MKLVKPDFAISYLIERFFYRLFEFIRHWYFKSFLKYSDFVINILERLDRIFALRVTLKNFFQPLYQDYSLLGYILGFIFRTSRILISILVYGLILIVALVLYIVWFLIPPFLIYKVFYPSI